MPGEALRAGIHPKGVARAAGTILQTGVPASAAIEKLSRPEVDVSDLTIQRAGQNRCSEQSGATKVCGK